MTLEIFEVVSPDGENGYCVFAPELEEDDNVFFHMTPAEKKEEIIENGFLSAQELGVGSLCSVSYAKRSSSCFANIGNSLASEYVIFAVRFETDALSA